DGTHRRRSGLGEIRDATAGHDPDIDGVDSGGVEASLQGGSEHRAGAAGVPADEDRAAPQPAAGGAADGQGELGSQVRPGGSTHAVGTEDGLPLVEETTEVGHTGLNPNAWCTGERDGPS